MRMEQPEAAGHATCRFGGSSDRAHPVLCKASCGEWRGDFSFVQLADTQFGLLQAMKRLWWVQHVGTLTCGLLKYPVPRDEAPALDAEEAYAKELLFAERAVAHVNALAPAPAFVVVCGDLVNAYPQQAALQELQVSDFKRILGQVREDVPLVCVCGNHDLGDRPNAATVDLFTSRFGDDYFAFWAGPSGRIHCRIPSIRQIVKRRKSCETKANEIRQSVKL